MNDRRRKLLEKKKVKQPRITIENPVEIEIKKFFEINNIDQERNPLKWFSENRDQFPLVTKLFVKYASIQATSVPSERLFNIASMVFDDRPSLLPEKAEKSVLLNDYYNFL